MKAASVYGIHVFYITLFAISVCSTRATRLSVATAGQVGVEESDASSIGEEELKKPSKLDPPGEGVGEAEGSEVSVIGKCDLLLDQDVRNAIETKEEDVSDKLVRSILNEAKATCTDFGGDYSNSSGKKLTLTQKGCSGDARGSQAWSYTVNGDTVSKTGTTITGTIDTLGRNGDIAQRKITLSNGEEFVEVPQRMSIYDPRALSEKLGWKRGLQARLVQLGRRIPSIRIMALELPGRQASELFQAQYGIITAQVPKACFSLLRQYLRMGSASNNVRSTASAKEGKQSLSKLMNSMESDCYHGGNKTQEGKLAARRFHSLRRGYWEIFEPLTDETTSTISAHALDLKRLEKGEHQLRQIWHYSKKHLLSYTEVVVRDELLKAVSRSEYKRLKQQYKVISKLEGMSEARLAFIEFNAKGRCADLTSNHMIKDLTLSQFLEINEALKGPQASYRTTMFFRERGWQPKGRIVRRSVTSPFVSLAKGASRWADEFAGGSLGHKFAMILRPLLKVVGIFGIVMGVVSGGATTFTTILAEWLVDEGLAQLFASSSAITFLVGKVIGAPFYDAAIEEAFTESEAFGKMQKFFRWIDDEHPTEELTMQLNDKVEELMEKVDYDESNEEAVRLYLGTIVYDGFINEYVPLLQQQIQHIQWQSDPDYGWLKWPQWQRYREGTNGKALEGLWVWHPDWVQDGYVSEASNKSWYLGYADNRTLSISYRTMEEQNQTMTRPPTRHQVKLSSELKKELYVRDVKAYITSNPGWIAWHEWVDYRASGNARELRNKAVRLNKGLRGCDVTFKPCLEALACYPDKEPSCEGDFAGFPVLRTSWKTIGLGDRDIFVGNTPGGAAHCFWEGITLTQQVKSCLDVKDAEAYQNYVKDSARRAQERMWNNIGEKIDLNIDPDKISQEVINEMRCKGNENAAEEADRGNDVLMRLTGRTSDTLDMQSQSLNANTDMTEEEKIISEVVQDGFNRGGYCKLPPRKKYLSGTMFPGGNVGSTQISDLPEPANNIGSTPIGELLGPASSIGSTQISDLPEPANNIGSTPISELLRPESSMGSTAIGDLPKPASNIGSTPIGEVLEPARSIDTGISGAATPTGSIATPVGGAATPTVSQGHNITAEGRTWEIEIPKQRPGEKIGIDVFIVNNMRTLEVKEVLQPGLVHKLYGGHFANPEKVVRKGDLILEANGVSGDAKAMLEVIKNSDHVKLLLQRN